MPSITVALPALIALLFKCYLLFLSVTNKHVINKYLVAVISLLAVMNIIEFIYFVDFGHNKYFAFNEYLLRIYYVVAIFTLICIVKLTSSLTGIYLQFYSLVHIFGICLIPLITFTNYLIVGADLNENSIASATGTYYILFQIFVITQIMTSLLLLTLSIFNEKKDILIRAKSSVILVSLLPGLFTIFVVMFAMELQVRINLALILPVVSTIFVWGCLYAAVNHRVIDFSIFLPGTPSSNRKNDILFFLYAGNNKSDVWKCLLNLERLYIEDALTENKGKGQLSNAAKDLGITPGKLDYRLKNIHHINHE